VPDDADEREDSKPQSGNLIGDEVFIVQLNKLRSLCGFFRQEIVAIRPEDTHLLVLGEVGRLRSAPPNNFFGKTHGRREPTAEEWRFVEERIQALYNLLDETQKRLFNLRQSESIIAWLPALLVVLSALALIGAILSETAWITIALYIFWLLFMRALGSVAFIAMNALSVQKDITFDLTNRRLLSLRVSLGAVFGLVLALPFGFKTFVDFSKGVRDTAQMLGQASPALQENADILKPAVLLLLPFVLGFSTSLVLSFLNKIIEAVDVILGKRPTP
jgi:hypothetical protein